MLRLLRLDYRKVKNYRPFWVLSILYMFLVVSVPISLLEFLKWLKMKGAEFDGFDPMKIPILFFPDIWQNITYFYTLPIFLIFLGILVIITISNEFSYKTIRQNIIDGLDRREFIQSKLSMIVVLSLASTLVVFVTCLLSGMIYTPDLSMGEMLDGMEFIFGYFLYVLLFLVIAFLLTVLLQRSALTIFLLLLYRPIEGILIAIAGRYNVDFLTDYLPLQAASSMIEVPFPRYWFQEITDYLPLVPTLVVCGYIVLFVYLISLRLRKADL